MSQRAQKRHYHWLVRLFSRIVFYLLGLLRPSKKTHTIEAPYGSDDVAWVENGREKRNASRTLAAAPAAGRCTPLSSTTIC